MAHTGARPKSGHKKEQEMKHFQSSMSILILGTVVASTLIAESYIGVASSRGSMSVNHESVRGNANLGTGASIQTQDEVSQVELRNGVRLTLGQRSSASFHADRAELTEGGAQISAKSGYGIEALGYRFSAENGEATARVAYENPNRVLISAMQGPVKVMNREGILMAHLAPGNTYFFEDQGDPQSARGAGQKNPATGKTARAARKGLSRGARWGIIGGAGGAAASLGIVAGLNNNDASR